jgi:hypothetical protein
VDGGGSVVIAGGTDILFWKYGRGNESVFKEILRRKGYLLLKKAK